MSTVSVSVFEHPRGNLVCINYNGQSITLTVQEAQDLFCQLNALDPIVRKDIETVIGFILEWFPGYEDAISWGEGLTSSDYDWYSAAQRLKDALANNAAETPSEKGNLDECRNQEIL